MSTRTHVTAVVRACFAALRQIWSVRQSVSRHALLTLARALIVSKVYYCSSVLAGISDQLQDQLQSVLNATIRLVFSARRSERITPLLRKIHWLRVLERVTFRPCVDQITALSKSCYYHISELRCIRRYLEFKTSLPPSSFILNFNYCNSLSLYHNLPNC